MAKRARAVPFRCPHRCGGFPVSSIRVFAKTSAFCGVFLTSVPNPSLWVVVVDPTALLLWSYRTGPSVAGGGLRDLFFVFGSSGPCPSLTRDRDGHLCVFTGKAKSVDKNLFLFTPLKGGDTITEGECVFLFVWDW